MDNLEKSPQGLVKTLKDINFEKVIEDNKIPIAFALVGVILVGLGLFMAKDSKNGGLNEVKVLETDSEGLGEDSEMVVEVAGEVEKPGVYKFSSGARVEDALIAAGGVSADADRQWMEKMLNRAAKIKDGQKIYVPKEDENEHSGVLSAKESVGDQSGSSGQGSEFENFVNVNNSSQKELEALWGIGPVTAQNIIEQRPYSSVEELLTKKILKTNVYERNKDLLTVY
jgi:competence protein ComEA